MSDSPLLFLAFYRPGIGDPTPAGWLTTIVYLLSAACGFTVFIRRRKDNRRLGRFWLVVSTAVLLLGVNKQLDLQTLIIDTGKLLTRAMGLSSEKRFIQLGFTFIVGGLTLMGLLGFLLSVRRLGNPIILACLGLTLILTYAVLRMTVFTHIPTAANAPDHTRLLKGLELLGTLLVLANTLLHLAMPSAPPSTPPPPPASSY